MACELVTVAALLASLVSIVQSSDARFLDSGAMPAVADRRANIDAWQWTPLPDGRLRVRGYTDARSPVGEPHRTYYQCDLVQLQPGRWRLDSLAVSAHRPT